MIAVFARPVVDLNLNGKHMAYHRSIDMKVNVRMLTLTDTVWNNKYRIAKFIIVIYEFCSIYKSIYLFQHKTKFIIKYQLQRKYY